MGFGGFFSFSAAMTCRYGKRTLIPIIITACSWKYEKKFMINDMRDARDARCEASVEYRVGFGFIHMAARQF
jgi:hypothetical protein